jgi:hypothetical protein
MAGSRYDTWLYDNDVAGDSACRLDCMGQSRGDTWPNQKAQRGTLDLANVGCVKKLFHLRGIRTPNLRAWSTD